MGAPVQTASAARRWSLPLSWLLVLLALAALVPLSVFAAVMVHQLALRDRAAAERRLTLATHDLARSFDREVASTMRALRTLGASDGLYRGDLPAFRAAARRALATQPSWESIILLAPDGQQLVNAAWPADVKLPKANDMASLRQAVASGEPTVGAVKQGRHDSRWGFAVRVPVYRDGKLTYILTGVVRAEPLANLVGPVPAAGEVWTRTLLDSQGIIAARSRDPDKYVGQPGRRAFLASIAGQDHGLERHTTIDGKAVFMAYSRAPLSGWLAAVAVPVDTLEGPVTRTLEMTLSIELGLVLLVSAATSWLARRIGRDLRSAADAAEVLARGTTPPAAPSRISELVRLHEALARSSALLEQRERERNENLERAEAARREAEAGNQARDEFLAMLGHELRNPLGPIRNGAHLLEALLPDDPELRKVRAMIQRQAGHIARLVDDLLDASRITRGKITLRLAPRDVTAIARSVGEDYRDDFEASKVTLTVQAPDEPVYARVDDTRISQCLGNLLHNALKFTPPGGTVTLAVTASADEVALSVTDTGAGIDAAVLPTLFSPFAQGPQSSARTAGGLGLGLSIARGLVTLHGGTIEPYSAGPGKGSRFTLKLPRCAGPATPARSEEPAGRSATRTILIVEDMADAAESLRMLLALDGHTVRVAHSGAAARTVLEQFTPDMVICDIGLPDVDGYTLCRELRARPGLEQATFVALTGYGQARDIAAARDAGYSAHLTKPLDLAALYRLLNDEEPVAAK